MEQPARIDIHADRWVACVRELAFVGYDFTGAVFASHVRAVKDSTGSPLVNLATVTSASAEGVRLIYAGQDTIDNHIAAGRLDRVPAGYSGSDMEYVSSVGIRINETTMEALPVPDDIGDDIVFHWDLHVSPTGGTKDVYCGGKFTVRAGATQ